MDLKELLLKRQDKYLKIPLIVSVVGNRLQLMFCFLPV